MADEFATSLNGNQQATPGPGAQPSFADFFKQYQKANPVKQDPFQNVYYDPQQVNRYKESAIYTPWIDPFADNETMAAQAQSGWEALWNGTKGSWDGIKDGFVSSAMVLPNLIGSIFTGSVEGMMDDEYGMQMGAYEQQQNQNENPIYMTESERDDIFSLKAAGEMMQNAGYTIGTFSELLTETVTLEFLAGAFTAFTGGAGAETLAATTALETGRWGKFLNSFRRAGEATGEAVNAFRYGTKTAELAAQDALRARTVAQQAEIIAQMGKLHDAQFGSKLGEKLYNFSTKIPIAGELIETGNVMRLANKTGLVSTKDLARIGAGGIRRAYGEFQAASGEAAIEAGGTYNDVYNSIYDDFVKENGYEPSADEEARMRELAKSAAVDSYGLNMGTLLLMNKIEFGNIFRHMNADNALVRAFRNDAMDAFTVTGRVGGNLESKAYTKGTFGRLGILPDVVKTFDNGYRVAAAQFGKGLVSGFRQFSVWEGLQENIQEGIVHGLKKHYSDMYNNDPATWGESFQEAVDSQMNKQGLKTFMMGAMTGVVTGPLITRTSKAIGYFGNREAYRSQQEETKKTVEAFNAFMGNHSKVLSEHIRKTKESNAYGEEMQRAAATDDQFNYLNSRESALMQAVHSAKRLGNLPLLLNTVKAYGQGFDNQAFKEAFGFSPEDAGYSSASEFTSRIAKDIQRYSDTFDNYMKKYSNFMDIGKYIKDPHRKLVSDISRAALIDAIETVSFHESKAQDAVRRRAGIQSKIAGYQTIGEALQTGFGQLTNLNEIENERDILKNEIQSLESIDTKDKDTERLIKVKREQLGALEDWMDAIGYKMDENTRQYTYNNVAIRRKNSPDRYKASDAFKRYLGARNAGLKRNQIVKQEEVDLAMQDVVDFMELGEENRKMVDALNMLNDPNGFAKTFQAAQNARIGAHARNVANVTRMLAQVDPAFAKLLEENEKLVRELEQFAEAPYGTNQNWAYLGEIQNKLKALLKSKENKVNNPKDENPKKPSQQTDPKNIEKDENGNPKASPKALEPENLQAMLDRGKDAEAMEFVNRHYIFKQIAGNRYSFKRVVDSRVPEPIVTHEGEFDITEQDSFNFAVKFETDLFNKNAKGGPVGATLDKEKRKLKNLIGRTFRFGQDMAELMEDDQGYYFQVYDPATNENIEEIDAGDNGNVSYTAVKVDGQGFELVLEEGEMEEGDGTQIVNTTVNGPAVNNEIQELEDQKEAAIRDEKQKLEFKEGERVMFEGEAGTIVKDGTEDVTSDGIDLISTPSGTIIEELNKLSSPQEKLDWLAKNKLITPITIDGKTYKAMDYNDRIMVMMKIGQYNIPFYISTGKAGKKTVKAGNWYVVFGIGSKGWINKGSSEQINDQYGYPLFQKFAKILNEGLGTIPSADESGKALPGFGFLMEEKIQQFNSQMNLPTEPAADNTQTEAFYNHVNSTLALVNKAVVSSKKSSILFDESSKTNGKQKARSKEEIKRLENALPKEFTDQFGNKYRLVKVVPMMGNWSVVYRMADLDGEFRESSSDEKIPLDHDLQVAGKNASQIVYELAKGFTVRDTSSTAKVFSNMVDTLVEDSMSFEDNLRKAGFLKNKLNGVYIKDGVNGNVYVEAADDGTYIVTAYKYKKDSTGAFIPGGFTSSSGQTTNLGFERDMQSKIRRKVDPVDLYSTINELAKEVGAEFEINDPNAATYSVKLDNGSTVQLGTGETRVDEIVGLTSTPQGGTSNAEMVPVEDRVFAIEFTSDDRSTVKIDGKEFTIIRNSETGEIAGLQYQTKSGPRVGRNGIFQQYINAITTSFAELSEALAGEDQNALASDIEDMEANSLEVKTVSQILDTIPEDPFYKFIFDETLSPEEVEALRNSFLNVLTLKKESSIQGPLMDQMEEKVLQDLNKLNAKYPPDERPKNPAAEDKGPKQAKRRGKAKNQKSNDDANSSVGQKVTNPRKGKSKPNSVQESVEQLELAFEEAKNETRVKTDNPNVTPVAPVEQYASTLDTLVSDLLTDPDDLTRLVNFVENSTKTTKKSTKNRKFDVGSTPSQDEQNPFESLGEGIFCNR